MGGLGVAAAWVWACRLCQPKRATWWVVDKGDLERKKEDIFFSFETWEKKAIIHVVLCKFDGHTATAYEVHIKAICILKSAGLLHSTRAVTAISHSQVPSQQTLYKLHLTKQFIQPKVRLPCKSSPRSLAPTLSF